MQLLMFLRLLLHILLQMIEGRMHQLDRLGIGCKHLRNCLDHVLDLYSHYLYPIGLG